MTVECSTGMRQYCFGCSATYVFTVLPRLKFSDMAVNDKKTLGHFSLNNSALDELSEISLAVPADSILQKSVNQNRTPRFLKPGITTSVLQSIPEDMKKRTICDTL